MFLNCKHLFGFFGKIFLFFFFRNNMMNFLMFVHILFIFTLYSVLVLDRTSAATRPTECFYTPSSSNPSIRKSLGTATGAFPMPKTDSSLREVAQRRMFRQIASPCICKTVMQGVLVCASFHKTSEHKGVVIFHKNLHARKMNFYKKILAFFTLS